MTHLSEIVGKIEAEKFIYDGLIEALNNTKHHAYSDEGRWYGVPSGTWLMCGAYDSQRGKLTAAVYDMGVGIPYTLPRSGLWENIKGIVAKLGRNDDAALISAAMEAGRTRTGLKERGKGLPIMMRLFDHIEGHLRIISGHGEITYASKDKELVLDRKNYAIGGTLIQWQMEKPKTLSSE